jgi:hypothetical protein
MGDNFKIWRLLNAGGVLAEEHKLAVEAMQFLAAIAMAKPWGCVNMNLNLAKYNNNNNHWKGQTALHPPADIMINTDMSQCGWGAISSCMTLTLASWWRRIRRHHINKLEL